MLHTNNPIIKHKAGLLNLAEELGNVSRACKVMGVSRDTFYRYQELVEGGGIDSLIDKSRRAPNLKNRVDEVTEQAVSTSPKIVKTDPGFASMIRPISLNPAPCFHKSKTSVRSS